MRSIAFCAIVLTALCGCAAPRVDVAAATAALRTRSQALQAAEGAQNIDAAMAFWAPDAIVQPAGAPQAQGSDAIRTLYQSFFGGGRLKKLEGIPSRIEVSQGGDLAYEYGVNRLVFAGPKGDLLDVGKYLLVWKKIDGQWYAEALSFTSDAPAPVAVPSK